MRQIIYLFILTLNPFIAIAQNCNFIKDQNLNENTTFINCNSPNSCINLNTSFPKVISSKTYNSLITTYSPHESYNDGIALQANEDDQFIKKINFNELGGEPFVFHYYGEVKNSFVISTNGFISFNPNYQVGAYSTPDLNNNQIPSYNLPRSSIFGIHQDFSFSRDHESEIYINITGEYPCRTLAINYYKAKIVGTTQTATFQIVLHELSSKIDINILEKPSPDFSARFKSSLIGITDKDGNGIAAKNTGIWEAQNESYSYIPNGPSINPEPIKWSNSNEDLLPSGNNLQICTFNPFIYTATAKYKLSPTEFLYLKDQHELIIDTNYPLAKDYNATICNPFINLTQSSFYASINQQDNFENFIYKYYSSENDAQNNNSNYLENDQLLTYNSTYYVRIENPTDQNCFQIAKLEIGTLIDLPSTIEICDNNNDAIENYNLNDLTCLIFEDQPIPENIRYYVNNSTLPVSSFNLTDQTKLRVVFTTESCPDYTSGEIIIRFLPAPIRLIEDITITSDEILFDIVTNNNPSEREPFNWIEAISNLNLQISPDVTPDNYKVFKTLQNAKANTNPVDYISEGKPNLDYNYTWYLRIDNSNRDCKGNCYTIIPIKLMVKFRKIILNINDKDTDQTPDDPRIYDNESADIYLCANQNYLLNIKNDILQVFNVTNYAIDELNITFHTSYSSANNLSNNGINPIINTTNSVDKNYYVRLKLNNTDYIVKHVKYHFLPNIPLKNKIDICVDNEINSKSITPNDFKSSLLLSKYLDLDPNPIIEFYTDENGTILIENLEINRAYKKVWVKIKYTQTENICEAISPIEFKLISVENILKNYHQETLMCDNNLDHFELVNLNNYIINYVNTPANYNYKFYQTFNESTSTFSNEIEEIENYRVDGNSIIYIAISSSIISNTCEQEVVLDLNFNPDPLRQIYLNEEANLLVCNYANNQFVQYNLEDAIPQFFNNPTDYDELITGIKYYKNYNDAFLGNDNYIQNPSQLQISSTNPSVTIYVRFDNSFGCFNIKPIHLSIIGFIKLKANLSFNVCDTNFDGLYDFTPQQWLQSINTDNDTSNDLLTDVLINRFASFKLFYSLADYHNGIEIPLNETIRLDPAIHQNLIISAAIEGGCEDYLPVQINYSAPNTTYHDINAICDENNDGLEALDLTVFENNYPQATFEYYSNLNDLNATINAIENPNNYNLNVSSGNKIYVKVNYENTCPEFIIITYKFNQSPVIVGNDYEICEGETITISPNYKNWTIVKYEWIGPNGAIISNERTINVDLAGNYRLILTTDTNCTTTTNFTVTYKSIPNFREIIVQSHSVEITASGDRKILYSLDGINWQEKNQFEYLDFGRVSIYIKYYDSNCILGPFKTLIPKIYNTISPNGDGVNEVWRINDLDVFSGQEATLFIFDRYGKKLYQQNSSTELIWDGKINGKPLPSSSYWYTITFPDGRKYTGYINVINKY